MLSIKFLVPDAVAAAFSITARGAAGYTGSHIIHHAGEIIVFGIIPVAGVVTLLTTRQSIWRRSFP
jgi:hypothetical protein